MPRIVDRVLGMLGLARHSMVQAAFDLVQTNNENKRHWRDADNRSGRSAYPANVRKTARERSRHEAGSNSWYAGLLRTAANHIVGCGPTLQVLTADPAFNERIEKAWEKHAEKICLVDKLRVGLETYWRDGEWFAMRAERKDLHPITLDIRAYEADQVADPYWATPDPDVEDGKRVDNLGNAIEYWFYDRHPGDTTILSSGFMEGDWYPAEDVIHLYRADRPGQLRGFPRCAPAIDWLAHMRRFSKATLTAAESAALWGVFVKTTGSGVMPKTVPDFTALDYERGAMNFMPEGWEPSSIDPKHPGQSNAEYQRTELTYFCRCANMPYSLAAGTSRDSNFASAKMDVKNTWEPEVQSEQYKLSRDVMSRIIRWFFEDIAIGTDLLHGAPLLDDIPYEFSWPPLPQADEIDQADAAMKRIQTGISTLPMEYARNGEDGRAALMTGAAFYNVSVETYQAALFAKHFAISGVPGGVPDPTTGAAAIGSAGAFTGAKRRDFLNNEKATGDVLQALIDGASEVRTKASLIRLGWSAADAKSLIEDAKDGSIDSQSLDPATATAGVAA